MADTMALDLSINNRQRLVFVRQAVNDLPLADWTMENATVSDGTNLKFELHHNIRTDGNPSRCWFEITMDPATGSIVEASFQVNGDEWKHIKKDGSTPLEKFGWEDVVSGSAVADIAVELMGRMKANSRADSDLSGAEFGGTRA